MKLPTMSVGMPYGSRRIVNEKQQLMKPSSFGGCSFPRAGVVAPDDGSRGLYRSTHDVRTAFCVESNATFPYFWHTHTRAPGQVIKRQALGGRTAD